MDAPLRLSLPHLSAEAIERSVEVLRSGHLVHGAEGEAFEAELAAYLETPHAVLVSSGTAALHLALLALGIGPGDAVLVPDFTFPATGNAVRLVGATPVLVDVDRETYCIDASLARVAVRRWRERGGRERLRAVMPVHEFGFPVEMKELLAWARETELLVVEDAACAIGARVGARAAGTFGDIGCFSLHPRKTLTTGEGGVLCTAIPDLARRMRRLRNHGMERTAEGMQFVEAGFNYRLTNVQSALGRAQLPSLDGWIEARRALAAIYHEALGGLAAAGLLVRPTARTGHSWQTYLVVLAEGVDRSAVIHAMAAEGIEANLGAQCLSALPPFADCDAEPASRCQALRLYRQGLAIPFCEQYGRAEVERVVGALSRALASR
jgi:dTDP-4-amino-4,6-dideoxygalactose transaminase